VWLDDGESLLWAAFIELAAQGNLRCRRAISDAGREIGSPLPVLQPESTQSASWSGGCLSAPATSASADSGIDPPLHSLEQLKRRRGALRHSSNVAELLVCVGADNQALTVLPLAGEVAPKGRRGRSGGQQTEVKRIFDRNCLVRLCCGL